MPQKIEQAAALAAYRSIRDYKPKFSDFVVWCGWFRTWYGVVSSFIVESGKVKIIFEGTPRLLFTLAEDEMEKASYEIPLSDLRNQRKGSWSILQDEEGKRIWYI